MKKIRSVLSRHRLMINVLALVFVLGTLAAPAAADDFELIVECANGCTNWNQQNGCVYCQRCCNYGGGNFECWQIPNNQCS
jgi:hypothetical protein